VKNIFIILFLLMCSSLFAQNLSLDQAVQSSSGAIEARLPQGVKVAVLAFTSPAQAFSDYVIDELAIAISASNKIQIIERQYTDVIRSELNIQRSGDVSDDQIRNVGQQLGAQYVVTGSLVDIGNAYRFRVAAINVETAVREGSSSLSIDISDPQVVFLLTGQRPAAPEQRVGSISSISSISFSGTTWALQSDGRRSSPNIFHNQTTKTRVHFTSTGENATITIHLWVSSESGHDIAFIGNLNSTASYTNNYARISGDAFRTVTITVPTPGIHYIEIGYRKDISISRGSDRAWFRIEI